MSQARTDSTVSDSASERGWHPQLLPKAGFVPANHLDVTPAGAMALTGVIGYGPDSTRMGGCIDNFIRLVRSNDCLLAGSDQIDPDQPFHAEAFRNAGPWLKRLIGLVTIAERSPGDGDRRSIGASLPRRLPPSEQS